MTYKTIDGYKRVLDFESLEIHKKDINKMLPGDMEEPYTTMELFELLLCNYCDMSEELKQASIWEIPEA
jgi:hypothetical protein